MVSILPVSRALLPVDSDAATQISAPNYDEFQSDREVWELLQARPDCVLRITMPHCHVADGNALLPEGGGDALQHASDEMRDLKSDARLRTIERLLWVYEVVSPLRPEIQQIGLGGFGRTSEIRTDDTPAGCIIRNEGIRPEKAEGRARLIEATDAYIGTVNCAVEDARGTLTALLEQVRDARDCDFATRDETGNQHRVWLVADAAEMEILQSTLAAEAVAYVADGNHRSAAAAQLKKDCFLAVFFPMSRMHLEPYNRLLPAGDLTPEALLQEFETTFEVARVGDLPGFRPDKTGVIGLYVAGSWYRLTPRPGTFDAGNAAASIDAAIVQQHIIDGILGITDARDKRINYVGGNRDAAWLRSRVDAGDFDLAISLAPVTMEQFAAVCRQNQFMPPKSTWFDPKIRSGLVIALLDE